MGSGLALKQDIYGQALLAAMGLFALSGAAFIPAAIFGKGQAGRVLRVLADVCLLAGAVGAGVLWVYRWQQTGHLPMQTMFEVFLFMGMLMWPLSAFCRFVLGARLGMIDAALAVVIAFPAAYVNSSAFTSEVRTLPPALQSWIFGPHVSAYMAAYVLLILAAAHGMLLLVLEAGRVLLGRGGEDAPLPAPFAAAGGAPGPSAFSSAASAEVERVIFRIMCFAFPLLTMGLVLGAVWGKVAWGDYWNWDPKEMWGLATWFACLGYFHFRQMFPTRLRWVNALWAIAVAVIVVLTLLSTIIPKLAAGGGMHTYAA